MANETTKRDPCDQAVSDGGCLRCQCGSLLARVVPGGIEVKCRRCKRTIVIALDHSKAR